MKNPGQEDFLQDVSMPCAAAGCGMLALIYRIIKENSRNFRLYSCDECNFNLDLACASSTNDLLLEEKWQRLKDGKKKEIQHYCHLHKLAIFKYRKIGADDYNCSWCGKRLSEVCYGCVKCKFFLHELCRDKVQRTLYHPFHPSHPLRLHSIFGSRCNACGKYFYGTEDYGTANYCCLICSFFLHFHCAKLLPTLRAKCHDHPLTYFNIMRYEWRSRFRCHVCKGFCDDNFYRCVQCDFSVHLFCVPIPSSIKHRYHRHPLTHMDKINEDDSGEYYCDVCENERNPMDHVYCCEECTFTAHADCVLNEDKISSEKDVSSSVPQSIYSNTLLVDEMEHNEVIDAIHTPRQLLNKFIFHEHSMRFYEVTEKLKENQYCEACRMVISGPYYMCETCTDDTFLLQIPKTREVCFGFFYSCNECDFKLDVKCAALTAHKTGVSQLKEMEKVVELHHFTHPHKLVFVNFIDPSWTANCLVCGARSFGLVYVCPNSNCTYRAHKSCLELPQKIQVPFHLEHMLTFFRPEKLYDCYACHLSMHFYIYSCEQCGLKLHPSCANSLRRPLNCVSHVHNLYYFGTNFQLHFGTYSHFCRVCEKDCTGAFYRCLECAINFHLDCVPIPRIVHSKRHVHHLSMKDSFLEDDSGEFYCDICEKERCPNDHVYYCEECNGLLAVHVECVLTKVEDYTTVLMQSQ
ncbi:Cysteine/Histidine-rich C1 domain family protein, putative isoform 1 [Theobroma cacao]|uniref:Cysteine/Histidine-rich C1 domain family protein, putative isoform 1 n=1 Tax=Theobroma cacao TaxID=3641 RepID=A0A061FYU1_THECC|nr:Cysteine/Histidine-rich C1 domain family protein, putative isoform 1 [Theobroma cacao]